VETLPAVAVNVVEVVPAGTMTELEPSCRVLLLDSRTSVPPVGAAPLNVTVHAVDAPEFNLLGLQANWETEIICPKATPDNKRTVIPVTAALLSIVNIRMITCRTNCRSSYLNYLAGRSRFTDQQLAHCL
jgi:hypothetical protein